MGIHAPTGLLHGLEVPTTYGELRQVMTIAGGTHVDRLTRQYVMYTKAGFKEREQALMHCYARDPKDKLPPDIVTGARLYLLDLDLLNPSDEPSALRLFLQEHYRSVVNEDDPHKTDPCSQERLPRPSIKQAS